MKAALAFVTAILTPVAITPDWAAMFVVWNVGQGQWLTYIDTDTCIHFDMGGERAPLTAVHRFCGGQANRLWLSHGDWDHIGFIRRSGLKGLCLLSRKPEVNSAAKRKLLQSLPLCEAVRRPRLWKIWEPGSRGLSANAASAVVRVSRFLIPGDSILAQEKSWALSPAVADTEVLISGHHGSRTSTGRLLLKRLPRLRLAIASSRKRKYGHPHFEVKERLGARGVPLLSTEDWGNLRLSP